MTDMVCDQGGYRRFVLEESDAKMWVAQAGNLAPLCNSLDHRINGKHITHAFVDETTWWSVQQSRRKMHEMKCT